MERCVKAAVYFKFVSKFRASSVLTEWRNGMVANDTIFDLMSVLH